MDIPEGGHRIPAPTARSLGAEVTSPWFYLQFGLILAAAGIAYAADAAIRARVDMSSLAMRWPLPLRHLARVLVVAPPPPCSRY